ncbi:MAG TPA: hypothetical protein VG326_15030 [Tepidisphaeraceae bacterium]|jgi:hypothetical protein|nr:hypothetical protein [Tepidisphaeraceae bacterium]
MTSHAAIFPASRDGDHRQGAAVAAWRRHAFVVPPMLVALAVCFWFATAGDGHLFYREYFCGFYDAQARSILHGRLDVPSKAIGFEAFDHAGKTYGYFGVTPALLRVPLVMAFAHMDGRWSRTMMLIAAAINLVCAYRLVLYLKPSHRIETDTEKILTCLFVLCAGIGSTTVFLVSRTYVYHEAIMWGATFALLFTDRLLAYLAAPSLSVLATVGACAFLSFHARATAGAGTLLAMCMLTLVLIVRASRNQPSNPPSHSPGGVLGLNTVRRPGVHAMLAAGIVIITIGGYFAINYAKFETFQGVPVRLYRMYTTNPRRMKITGGRQFHVENIPTGLASYFCGNALSFGPEFPWVYMVERARVLGSPALDVVEPYSGIPVSMPALFLLALAGIQPLLKGTTPQTRRLRLPAITLLLGGGVVLATVGITERYLHDFYPWLVVLASAGAARLTVRGHERAKTALLVWLTAVSVALNCAFALYFQREYVWGEPQAKREELVDARRAINHILHRPPPPPVTEQP